MAENKKSFVLYADLIHTVRKMPLKKAGELFMTILSYVNDENPSVNDPLVDLVFEPVKQQLKRDLKAWEETRVGRSEAGKLGGKRSGEMRRNKANEANASKSKQTEANEAVTVNATVTVNGNVKEREKAPPNGNVLSVDPKNFSIEHCAELAMKDTRWIGANKTNREELESFNRFLETLGTYEKNPADYKQHFANLKRSYPDRVKPLAKVLTYDELMAIAKDIDEQNKKKKAW